MDIFRDHLLFCLIHQEDTSTWKLHLDHSIIFDDILQAPHSRGNVIFSGTDCFSKYASFLQNVVGPPVKICLETFNQSTYQQSGIGTVYFLWTTPVQESLAANTGRASLCRDYEIFHACTVANISESATPWTVAHRFFCSGGFSSKKIRSGCQLSSSRVLPIQEQPIGLCTVGILYSLSHQASLKGRKLVTGLNS